MSYYKVGEMSVYDKLIGENLTKKKIIIKIGEEYCKPCREIEPYFAKYAQEQKKSSTIFISINLNESVAKLVEIYKIDTIPYFIVIGVDGKERVFKTIKSKEKLQKFLDEEVSS